LVRSSAILMNSKYVNCAEQDVRMPQAHGCAGAASLSACPGLDPG
jgi:hypothetical protein